MTAPTIHESDRKDLPLPTGHMTSRDQRIFHLNMVKLSRMAAVMLLTVEERLCINELLTAYHGPNVKPPFPWNARRTEKEEALHRRGRL